MTTETLLSNSRRGFYRFLKRGFDFRSDFLQSNLLFNLFERLCRKRGLWCGPAQKHQQRPITCSKWSNESVQDKGIECIGFECFNQVRIERSIKVSRGDPSTSYPCARGVQYNLIWAMRWGHQRKQKNPTTTWKQHGWLSFPFVFRIKGLHGRLYDANLVITYVVTQPTRKDTNSRKAK